MWCITQGDEMECGVSLRVVRWSVVYHSGTDSPVQGVEEDWE